MLQHLYKIKILTQVLPTIIYSIKASGANDYK
jgi:hypothetical protein